MKQRLLSLFAMLSLMISGAMAQSLTVADITAEAGQEATITVAVEGAAEMTALQFNLSLPEGFTLAGDIALGSAAQGHTLSTNALASGDLLVVLYSLQQATFADGTLLTIPVVAAEQAGTTEGTLHKVRTATVAAESKALSDVKFTAVVGEEEPDPTTYYYNVVSIPNTTDVLDATNYLNGAVEYDADEYPEVLRLVNEGERGCLHIVVPAHKKILIGALTMPGMAYWSATPYTIPGVTEYRVFKTGGIVAGGEARMFIMDDPEYVSETPVEVAAIAVDYDKVNLLVGDTWQLSASITPVFATDQNITWTSSDASVATVENGIVTAVRKGTAIITAKSGDKEAACEVTVEQEGDTPGDWYYFNVQYSKTDLDETNLLNGARRYHENEYPQEYDDKREEPGFRGSLHVVVPYHKKVTFRMYVGDLESGILEPHREYVAGGHRVFVYKTVISDEFGRKVIIADDPDYVPVTGIALDQTAATLTEGETLTLKATVSPDDATDKTVIWTTSDEAVVTVENGVITAVAPGVATITATAGSYSATCVVTVEKKVVAISGIALNKTTAALTEGETLTLVATVTPDNATDKTVTWSTSDAAVATVENGVVTAKAAGTATITAKAGDKTATCVVTVSKKGPAYVPGDVNNDGLIAIDDVVLTINKVLGITADNFVFAAADMNGDGEILVDDVVLVINAVLGSTTSSVQATRGMACETMTAIGTDYGFSLSTGNAADYVGMQFDMIIPGGISLKDILVSAGSNHTVAVSDRSDGVVRVIVTSMTNDAFGLGQLLDVHVSADKDAAVQLTNVYLATRSGALVGLADEEIVVFRTATDIQMMGQPDSAVDIYDLSGRLVKKAATSLDGLQKGVYMMNGKKITVR